MHSKSQDNGQSLQCPGQARLARLPDAWRGLWGTKRPREQGTRLHGQRLLTAEQNMRTLMALV